MKNLVLIFYLVIFVAALSGCANSTSSVKPFAEKIEMCNGEQASVIGIRSETRF